MKTLLICFVILIPPLSTATAQEPKPRLVLKAHKYRVQALAFSHDGKTLGSGGWDGRVKLWDSTSGDVKQTLPVSKEIASAVAFSPDDTLIATGGGFLYHGDVQIWKAKTGEKLWEKKDVTHVNILPVAFAPDGKSVISQKPVTKQDKTDALLFWDALSGKPGRTLELGPRGLAAFSINQSKDGSVLMTWRRRRDDAGKDVYEVGLWTMPAGKLLRTLQFDKVVRDASLSPDGKTVAVCLEDGTYFCEVAEEKSPALLAKEMGSAPVFSPDGKLLACVVGKEVKFRNAKTYESCGGVPKSDPAPRCLSFSPNSDTLAVGYDDGTIRLWDVAKITGNAPGA